MDLVYLGLALAFGLIAAAFARGCARLQAQGERR